MPPKISELNNPFSTGGGGVNFERNVQAVFVLSLLIDGLSPIIRYPIKKVQFQAKYLGIHTDDLAVFAEISPDKFAKLYCQIKHSISITDSAANTTFQDVIAAAWRDFNGEDFNRDVDLITLITGIISKDNIEALSSIHEQARVAGSSNDFYNRIVLAKFTSKKTRKRFDILRSCVEKSNNNTPISDQVFWEFCKCFCLTVFDIEYYTSINQCLIKAILRQNISSNFNHDAFLIWNSLANICGDWDQRAACVTRNDIPHEITDYFQSEDTSKIRVDCTVETNTSSKNKSIFRLEDNWHILALVGKWDDSNKNDRRILERLTQTSYNNLLKSVQKLSLQYPDYITVKDGIWTIHSRNYIIQHVDTFYFDNLIKDAFSIAIELLSEKNKRFDSDGNFSPIIPPSGSFGNSNGLRKALIEGLCILTKQSSLKNCSSFIAEHESCKLIKSVLGTYDWTRWASLSELLLVLAEVNPDEYLNALESYIFHSPEHIIELFPKQGHDFLTDPNFLTNILFSLEDLAWFDPYLVKCIRCLSALESLDYAQSNCTKTPISSIVQILFPFYPQTCSSIQKRKNALRAVRTEQPKLCWRILMKLLSVEDVIISSSARPQFIKIEIPDEIEVSENEKIDMLHFCAEQALDMVTGDVHQIIDLVKRMQFIPMEKRSILFQTVSDSYAHWSQEETYELWILLRKLLNNATSSSDVTPEDPLIIQLRQITEQVKPQNIIYQYKNRYMECTNDFIARDDLRQNTISEMYNHYGLSAVTDLAECTLDESFQIGLFLGSSIVLDDVLKILPEYQLGKNTQFYSGVLKMFIRTHGIEILNSFALNTFPIEFISSVLFNAPFNDELLDLISKNFPDCEHLFWKKVHVPLYDNQDPDYNIETVIFELLKYHRAAAAVNMLEYNVEHTNIDDALIYRILTEALVSTGPDRLDPYAVCELIKRLQHSHTPDIVQLSQLELAYLPFLTHNSDILPKALKYRIANEPLYFCEIIELTFKKRHDTNQPIERSKKTELLRERLYHIIFNFDVIPGTDWDGHFSDKNFRTWFDSVINWARKNDRYEVTLNTIGNGLSYAPMNEYSCHAPAIMEVLNNPEYDNLREGYSLGIRNRRGVHWVDPSGKEEQNLAQKYKLRADDVESQGYSRLSETLNRIADSYVKEAAYNQKHADDFD